MNKVFDVVSWAKAFKGPWKMQFYFNEIKHLSLECFFFCSACWQIANGMADTLAKQGIDRICNLSAAIGQVSRVVPGTYLLYQHYLVYGFQCTSLYQLFILIHIIVTSFKNKKEQCVCMMNQQIVSYHMYLNNLNHTIDAHRSVQQEYMVRWTCVQLGSMTPYGWIQVLVIGSD